MSYDFEAKCCEYCGVEDYLDGEHDPTCTTCRDCRDAHMTKGSYGMAYTHCGDCGSESALSDFYGGDGPQTMDELHRAAWAQKQGLR